MLARFARWLFQRTHRQLLAPLWSVANTKQPNERQYLRGRKDGAKLVLKSLGL